MIERPPRNDNVGDGVPTVPDAPHLAAFDVFPKCIREVIAEAPGNLSALHIRQRYLRHRGNAESFAEELRAHFATLAKAGPR